MKKRNIAINPERSAVGSKQSNGIVERAIQLVMGQARTLKILLMEKYKMDIPYDSDFMDWLFVNAEEVLNRQRIMQNGKTPFFMIKGRSFVGHVAPFGEMVFYLRANSPKRDKLTLRVGVGMCLGHEVESNEIRIGTTKGVIKCRSIMKMYNPQRRWNAQNMLKIIGTPFRP